MFDKAGKEHPLDDDEFPSSTPKIVAAPDDYIRARVTREEVETIVRKYHETVFQTQTLHVYGCLGHRELGEEYYAQRRIYELINEGAITERRAFEIKENLESDYRRTRMRD